MDVGAETAGAVGLGAGERCFEDFVVPIDGGRSGVQGGFTSEVYRELVRVEGGRESAVGDVCQKKNPATKRMSECSSCNKEEKESTSS